MQTRLDRYFGKNKPYTGLGRASLHSGLILVAARFLNVIVQVGSTVLIARQLDPRDFGLVAIVLALTGFAPLLTDLGTTDAATRTETATRQDISTLFWLNVTLGCVFTLLFAAASGFLAWAFGERALVNIALVSSLTFVMTGLAIQHYALMRRAMEFRRIAVIDISANIVSSAIAVAMAFTGWGYWALVVKPLLTLGIVTLGAWMSCPWVPGRPGLTPRVRCMVRFGLGITGFTVTDHLTRSADRLALGYFYGSGPLGYFQNAFLLYSNAIAILSEPLHNVAVSGLSKLKDDADQLKRSWAAALKTLSFVSTVMFAILAVTGTDFVVLLLGEKWAPAGPLLCVFAVRGIAHGIERTLGWLHVVAGRTDRWMRWGIFSAGVQLLALVVGLPFGPLGVAIAYAIAMFGLFIPSLVYAGRPLDIGVRDVLSATGPQTVAAVAAAALTYLVQQAFLTEVAPLTRFLFSSQICLTIYLALAVVVFRVHAPLKLANSVVRDLIAKRTADRSSCQKGEPMTAIERSLIKLDSWPWSAAWRVMLGIAVAPMIGVMSRDGASASGYIAVCLGLLIALRLVPAVLRHTLPVSNEAREIWKARRVIAKEYDSYQWQKLFWIGLGMLPYAVFGGLGRGGLLIASICLIGGGAGLAYWLKPKHVQT